MQVDETTIPPRHAEKMLKELIANSRDLLATFHRR